MGLPQGLEPRPKIITLLMLLVAVRLSHELWIIVALYLLALDRAYFPNAPVGFLIKRVWLFTHSSLGTAGRWWRCR